MTLGAEAFPDFERIRRAVSERDAQFKRNPVLYPAELRRHSLIKLTAEIIGGVCTPAHPLLTLGTIGNRHTPSFTLRIGNPTVEQNQGNAPRIYIHGRVLGSKNGSVRLSYERIWVQPTYPDDAALPNLFRCFFRPIGKNAAARPPACPVTPGSRGPSRRDAPPPHSADSRRLPSPAASRWSDRARSSGAAGRHGSPACAWSPPRYSPRPR
jgi:hypothetical protein